LNASTHRYTALQLVTGGQYIATGRSSHLHQDVVRYSRWQLFTGGISWKRGDRHSVLVGRLLTVDGAITATAAGIMLCAADMNITSTINVGKTKSP